MYLHEFTHCDIFEQKFRLIPIVRPSPIARVSAVVGSPSIAITVVSVSVTIRASNHQHCPFRSHVATNASVVTAQFCGCR